MAATVPVIAVVGASGSGKTLLMEALIAELTRRGYRVGAIKHSHSGFELDIPGKDTWRYARAGAAGVAISSRGRVGAIRRLEGELAPEEVAALLPDVDVVLAEGFGGAPWPKVEVRGRGEGAAAGPQPSRGPRKNKYENVVAVVGEGGGGGPGPRGEKEGLGPGGAGREGRGEGGPRGFGRDDVQGLTGFLEEGWLAPDGGR